MTPSDGVEREDPVAVHERQEAEREAQREERRARLGHEPAPKSKKKKAAKPKEETPEAEA